MERHFGTSIAGTAFDGNAVQAVWEKAVVVPGSDPAIRRKDACGAWIYRAHYGFLLEDGTGWEIDHILPISQGGTDDLDNLQPLQWENNRHKSDKYPKWDCARSAKG
jgi:hypothetical protein